MALTNGRHPLCLLLYHKGIARGRCGICRRRGGSHAVSISDPKSGEIFEVFAVSSVLLGIFETSGEEGADFGGGGTGHKFGAEVGGTWEVINVDLEEVL